MLCAPRLHHWQENVHKSTSIHACILSPQWCRFVELRTFSSDGMRGDVRRGRHAVRASDLSAYDPATTLLLFPSAQSLPLSHPAIVARLPALQRLVVVESTWQKAASVFSAVPHLGLHALQHVHLDTAYESTYWRYQELGRNALSTVEAMYYACKEVQLHSHGLLPAQRLDDLLYLYAHMHRRVHRRYDPQQRARGDQGEVDGGGGAEGRGEGEGENAGAEGDAAPRRAKRPPRAWQPGQRVCS